MFKDGSSDGFGPTMEQEAEFRHSLLTQPQMDDAPCANNLQHCLDTFRRSVQTAHTPSKI